MFRSARWRSEKNKIEAVFKLQFHVTQVTRVRGDSLIISFVPADVSKPTVRLEKATIRDGSCFWENHVYETVKFFREPKTGKIHEKIYNFVVSTGSLKAGLIGEVSIDFSSYAYSIKLSAVSLPLKSAKSEAVFHVSIQRMHENIEQREAEEIKNRKKYSKVRSFKALLSVGDADESIESNSTEDGPLNRRTLRIAKLNGNHRAFGGSDLTISSSDSCSGLDTPRQFGLDNSDVLPDSTSFLSSASNDSLLQKTNLDFSKRIHEDHQTTRWDWIKGSNPEFSADDSSSSSREKSEEASNIEIENLKTELATLSRQAEVTELKLRTLRKQIVREGKRGNDLFKEVVSLKEERDVFKAECENLKALQRRMDEAKVKNKFKSEGGDPCAIIEEFRQELNYEKDLNANLRLQVEKTQESNSELILAVRDLDEMLEQNDREIINLSNKSAIVENVKDLSKTSSKSETEDNDEQKALEELVLEHSVSGSTHEMEQKTADLYNELEFYRREREVQIEQLALDYEILKQENHELSYKLEQSQVQEQLKMQYECSSSYANVSELETQNENMEIELKNRSREISDSLTAINKLETHVKSLEEELEKQEEGFLADIEILTCAKVEQEQRAIRAEEAVRMMRWQNTNTAERLQEEFRRFSVQMSSTFEEKEELAAKAQTEASELRLQKTHLEKLLQKEKEELESVRDECEAKLYELSSQISLKVDQIEQMQSEIEDRSKEVEREMMHGEESSSALSQELLLLREEIERLKRKNSDLSVEAEEKETLKVELEQIKTEMTETEMHLFRGNVERDEMERIIALLGKETEKSIEEQNILRNLKDEKESMIGNLQLELETLRSQYEELKHTLFGDESEKDKLRKQLSQLKGELKKEEGAFSSLEKKLNDTKSRLTVLDESKTSSRNNKSASAPHSPKEMASLNDKINLLEGQIKLKEDALDTSTNSFLEKEKDLQNKIAELERRLEKLSQHGVSLHEYELQTVAEDPKNITSNGCTLAESSGNEISFEKGMETSALNVREQGQLDELLDEMDSLKERNKSMESELTEMQERYSEISLKFAEVEGERQQLVMALRNLKNAKRI